MLACETSKDAARNMNTLSLSFLFDKESTNSFFFLFFFYNFNLESKGELNYLYLFSPYRERVGFITFIYFTFFLSP